jgi:mannitol/fructose-specific phosphotransferase system IIA component (Ntr-type)
VVALRGTREFDSAGHGVGNDRAMNLKETATALGFPLVTLPAVAARSKEDCVAFLVNCLVERGFFKTQGAAEVVRKVLQRESLGSTGIGGSVALPHVLSPATSRVVGILAHCTMPVPWEAVDGKPVETICLIFGPSDHGTGDYLHALEKVARAVKRHLEDRATKPANS